MADLNIRAKEIRVTLEEESVREIVEEAEETSFDSEDIHYFKELLEWKIPGLFEGPACSCRNSWR